MPSEMPLTPQPKELIMRITTRTLSYTTADGLTLQSYLCLPEEAPN